MSQVSQDINDLKARVSELEKSNTGLVSSLAELKSKVESSAKKATKSSGKKPENPNEDPTVVVPNESEGEE